MTTVATTGVVFPRVSWPVVAVFPATGPNGAGNVAASRGANASSSFQPFRARLVGRQCPRRSGPRLRAARAAQIPSAPSTQGQRLILPARHVRTSKIKKSASSTFVLSVADSAQCWLAGARGSSVAVPFSIQGGACRNPRANGSEGAHGGQGIQTFESAFFAGAIRSPSRWALARQGFVRFVAGLRRRGTNSYRYRCPSWRQLHFMCWTWSSHRRSAEARWREHLVNIFNESGRMLRPIRPVDRGGNGRFCN
jgi:hypothetical protein